MSPIVVITLSFISGLVFQKVAALPIFIPAALSVVLFVLTLLNFDRKKTFSCLLIALIFLAGATLFSLKGLNSRGSEMHFKSDDDKGFLLQVRKRLSEVPRKILPEMQADLLGSMIFGSKVSKPPDDLKEDFRKTGTIHLLVASGLHLSILLGSIMALFRFMNASERTGATVAAAFGLFYVVLAGAGASIVRAYIMAGMTILAGAFGREKDALTSLSFAALILLLIDPLNLFQIGFQLSFSATFSLLFLAPLFEEHFKGRIPRFILIPFSVSLSPFLMTMPLILYYFSQFSVVSVLANALIIPWVAYVIILGFCSISIGSIFLPLAFIFSGALFFLLTILIGLVSFFSSLPFACFYMKPPSIPLMIGYYAGMAWLIYVLRNKVQLKLDRIMLLTILLVIGSIFTWHIAFSGFGILPDRNLKIFVIDVGQGDSIFILTPSGKKMLIDGGDKYGGKFGAVPFLKKNGINHLDIVVPSHPHADHAGGLPEVLKTFKVDTVLDSGQAHTPNFYKNFLALIEKNRVKYKVVRAGDILDFKDGVVANILGPSEPLLDGTNSDANNNSIVMKLVYKDFSMLFVGDAEKEAEERLLSAGVDLESDILKVGHHGSKTSTSPNFLEAVNPKIAVISSGKRNNFGHPSPVTLERLKGAGIKVLRTDEKGTILIETDGRTTLTLHPSP